MTKSQFVGGHKFRNIHICCLFVCVNVYIGCDDPLGRTPLTIMKSICFGGYKFRKPTLVLFVFEICSHLCLVLDAQTLAY